MDKQTEVSKPKFCLELEMSSFDGKTAEVIAVKWGETGYYKTTWGRQTREWVEEQNARMGIDGATQAAMGMCSIFGNWSNYESVHKHIGEAIRDASKKDGSNVENR